jgi:hypothetical protein
MDHGEPGGVAFYRRERRAAEDVLVLDRLDTSEPAVTQMRQVVNDTRKQVAVRSFYTNPDYSIYSLKPNDDHPQQFVQYQHRMARVDERLAPLILELWKRGWDTLGSCQELRPGTPDPGKAYVDFPFPEHGQAFVRLLEEAGLPVLVVPSTQKITKPDQAGPRQEYTLDKLIVRFSPNDIDRIVALLQGSPVHGPSSDGPQPWGFTICTP